MSRNVQRLIEPTPAAPDTMAATVFSSQRTVQAPEVELSPRLKPNTRLKMDGLEFLALLPEGLDPRRLLRSAIPGGPRKARLRQRGERQGASSLRA